MGYRHLAPPGPTRNCLLPTVFFSCHAGGVWGIIGALLLLSRINGDAPRASILAAAFGWVREWADFNHAGAALREHPDAKPSPRPLRRSHFTLEASPDTRPAGRQRNTRTWQ